ncbi:hypothetical protein BG57_32960 [Caballeronia grimmiae]|uniref:Uncharacterized protein n=2 Tax=Caballeronia grimmiae TaxID=1071679 RepID=A0A069NAB1_9BURK|nr:hypothetical protein BG57_32960 [Caballeronia grimmiae]
MQHHRNVFVKHFTSFYDLIIAMLGATYPITKASIATSIDRHTTADLNNPSAVAGCITITTNRTIHQHFPLDMSQ